MENPYQKPLTDSTLTPQLSHNLVATQTAVYHLSACKGWVRLVSVLMFIVFSLLTIGLLSIFALIANFGSRFGNHFILGSTPGVFLIIIILTYLFLIFFLGFRLSGYASAIGRLTLSRNPIDLETAMVQQMKFWRLSGIITLVAILLSLFSIAAPLIYR